MITVSFSSREWSFVAKPAPSVPDVERVAAALGQRAAVQPLYEEELLRLGAGSD